MTMTKFSMDLHGHSFSCEELSASFIEDAIKSLDGFDTYAVLEPTPPIESCIYLQTSPSISEDSGLRGGFNTRA
jgi:hypothetical protein